MYSGPTTKPSPPSPRMCLLHGNGGAYLGVPASASGTERNIRIIIVVTVSVIDNDRCRESVVFQEGREGKETTAL